MSEPLPGNGITEKQLKFGYWFVAHRLLLKKILMIALAVISAALWGTVAVIAFRMFVLYGDDYERLVRDRGRSYISAEAVAAATPLAPQVIQTYTFNTSNNRYDLAAVVKNLNTNRYARFGYRFVGEGFATPVFRGVLIPGQETVLTALGQELSARPRGAQLEFSDFVWTRISKHDVPDPASYVAERIAFAVADASYVLGPPARSSFAITNNTAYSYWQVVAVVLLKRGSTVVGVNTVTIPQFRSGESRSIELTWFDTVSTASGVEVRLQVDIFDPTSFMPPSL